MDQQEVQKTEMDEQEIQNEKMNEQEIQEAKTDYQRFSYSSDSESEYDTDSDTTDSSDDEDIIYTLDHTEGEDLEDAILAIKYLKRLICKKDNNKLIIDQLCRVMRFSWCESERMNACIDAINASCKKREQKTVDVIMKSLWCSEKSFDYIDFFGKHQELQQILECLKKRFGKQLFEYLYNEIVPNSLRVEVRWEILSMICANFQRSDLIEYGYLRNMTWICRNSLDIRSLTYLLLDSNLVDYFDIANNVFKDALSIRITYNEFRQIGKILLIKANEFKEKTAESDEKEKENIDRYLKLLSPLEMLHAAEDLHLAKVLSDEEMNNIRENYNKCPSFKKNWLESGKEKAPEAEEKAEEGAENQEQSLSSYFTSFFL